MPALEESTWKYSTGFFSSAFAFGSVARGALPHPAARSSAAAAANLMMSTSLTQRLFQIRNQIVGMLQPNRHPQQIPRRPGLLAFHRGAVLTQAVRATQAGGAGKQPATRRHAHRS